MFNEEIKEFIKMSFMDKILFIIAYMIIAIKILKILYGYDDEWKLKKVLSLYSNTPT